MQTLKKIGQVFAILVFLAATILIAYLIFLCIVAGDGKTPRGLPTYQKIKIERYCKDRGIRPQVIEIYANGRMFYLLDNGRRAEIK